MRYVIWHIATAKHFATSEPVLKFPSLLALQPTKKEGMFDSLWTRWYLIPSACWVNFKQHQTPDTQIGNDNAIVPWD